MAFNSVDSMDYVVDYKLYVGIVMVKEGCYTVKNCDSSDQAKQKLKKYLAQKYRFTRMTAKVKDDDILKAFGRIFGKNWFN
jgi:hypothetical protein